jgi:hypothetical protein
MSASVPITVSREAVDYFLESTINQNGKWLINDFS